MDNSIKINKRKDFLDWIGIIIANIVIFAGLYLFIGGAWLVFLGGSFYFVAIGLGLLISGYLLISSGVLGVWLYFALVSATLIWALWEVGLDGWALIPRLAAPLIVAVVLALLIPVYRRKTRYEKA